MIGAKNDAKEEENVGFFSLDLLVFSFFAMEKKRNRRENLLFYLMRSGSSRDSSSPYERKNPIYDMVFKIEM